MLPPRPTAGPRVLIAGIGNVLRGDDGFGPAVVHALQADGRLAPGVHCIELGIGGIGLVHELMAGYEALVVVDAVDRGGPPGSLYILEPEIPNWTDIPEADRHALTGDMHQAIPGQALVIAQAVGVLPPFIRLIGCQPAATEELTLELSPVVQRAVAAAVEAAESIVDGLNDEPAHKHDRKGKR